ncbi:MAG: penicillin acylase family protein, partial [Gemmatimonadaceae bacterium]|nr:penicillin acylase family protein [Gemmatimonadaceae bacterium]
MSNVAASWTLASLVASSFLCSCVTGTTGRTALARPELARWEAHAASVSITRDDWGIPHVHGRTDADAVFGLLYAQAEDDFPRVETNYISALGRLAEVEGESQLYRDLRMRLFVDQDSLRARYAASPPWLQKLMDAFADGLNYYLHTHPAVTPRLITRFEPWMALSFTEGSIGGDVERVSLEQLEAFYGRRSTAPPARSDASRGTSEADWSEFVERRGSNGIAIAPSRTRSGNALLLINPHTTFFFRAEAQVRSDQGLDAYGAVTWGQFFVYQGFNERLGWMHTTSGADVVDEYAESVRSNGSGYRYSYAGAERPVSSRTITVPYRTVTGAIASRLFTVYATHHGPVVREVGGKWITVSLMQRPIEALSQSWLRTKARDLPSFRKVMELAANSSNNTVYADADGHIAYFHPQFVPIRDDRFDYTRPVDGSNSATDWRGVHTAESTPHVIDPPNGWLFNTNNWPYSAAGPFSPDSSRYPRYMDAVGENPRGVHAIRLLRDRRDFDMQALLDVAFDSYLTAFDQLLPPLFAAYDAAPPTSAQRVQLSAQVAALRAWDRRWSHGSVATTLAVLWGEELWSTSSPRASLPRLSAYDYIATRVPPNELLAALATVSQRLERDFGDWRVPWGEINRLQRTTASPAEP